MHQASSKFQLTVSLSFPTFFAENFSIKARPGDIFDFLVPFSFCCFLRWSGDEDREGLGRGLMISLLARFLSRRSANPAKAIQSGRGAT